MAGRKKLDRTNLHARVAQGTIANILDKQYYYCGTQWEDVKIKLKELGIGRDDPI